MCFPGKIAVVGMAARGGWYKRPSVPELRGPNLRKDFEPSSLRGTGSSCVVSSPSRTVILTPAEPDLHDETVGSHCGLGPRGGSGSRGFGLGRLGERKARLHLVSHTPQAPHYPTIASRGIPH